ncbi:MAG TPA: hypothetical protein VFQ61_19160 [Polyangiaceae bacterium]|nr:hypothetical protein [Polyangiaceae bacterium]
MFRARQESGEDESRYEIKEARRVFEARTSERFSRIEFALRVLDLLRPNMNVTLYESLSRIQVRRGRDWSVGAEASWALVAIPRTADRHSIAFALAELTGRADQAFVVDLVARAHQLSLAS